MSPELSPSAADVHAVAERLRQAVNAADVDGIVACWAPDGVMLPPAHAAVYGRDAIRDYFRGAFAARRPTFTFTDFVVDVFGTMAIELLHYRVVVVPATGEATEDVGKGVHLYTRRAGGGWQIALDIWNADHPPALHEETG